MPIFSGLPAGTGIEIEPSTATGVGFAVGLGVETGIPLVEETPALQIKRFPNLRHVYVLPAELLKIPFFAHFVPENTAAWLGTVASTVEDTIASVTNIIFSLLRMPEGMRIPRGWQGSV